ncbi:MAG: putative toxin-antitoxin system toxin component, PIN family [Saprospiraceae bacterium]|jgi:putative PIN family toxin of toxin-antitoxin system|nr:putative toxin-antitoxin system toxin component, PIN family [Saprospiraceae bacterium]
MKVVIDTNVLLVMLPEKSNDHDLFLALLNGAYEVFVTQDILLEYEEIIAAKNGHDIAKAAIELIASLPNVHFIRKYFYWNLIAADPDDDKFTDCAIAADAAFLVSDDKHFNVLKTIDFPKVNLLGKAAFRRLLGL